MSLIKITLQLPPDMLHVLDGLAREQDVTPGHLVRTILSQEISRRKNARPPIRVDERLIAPLRARLAPILAREPNWTALQSSLRAHGYELRQAGGGLALHRYPDGVRVCKASELGFSYTKLMLRLRAPFPGHTHTHLFERLKLDEHDEDFDVLETP